MNLENEYKYFVAEYGYLLGKQKTPEQTKQVVLGDIFDILTVSELPVDFFRTAVRKHFEYLPEEIKNNLLELTNEESIPIKVTVTIDKDVYIKLKKQKLEKDRAKLKEQIDELERKIEDINLI